MNLTVRTSKNAICTPSPFVSIPLLIFIMPEEKIPGWLAKVNSTITNTNSKQIL